MNIGKMMKQAQEMQAKMKEAQEALAEEELEVSVGGGHVVVKATASGDVTSIKISPDVVDPEDVEMLEDLVLTGVRQAIEKGRDFAQQAMSEISSGMGLPPGMGL